MEAKEKARELFDKYQIVGSQWYVDTTKKYALITVDEILSIIDEEEQYRAYKYWQEVKREIENL
jgi:hydrogenase maturation factor